MDAIMNDYVKRTWDLCMPVELMNIHDLCWIWEIFAAGREVVEGRSPLHSTPLTGRAIKPQRQGHIGGPIAQPWEGEVDGYVCM